MLNTYRLKELQITFSQNGLNELLVNSLKLFKSKDNEIESYITNPSKALEDDKNNITASYIIIDDEKSTKSKLHISAYFCLSLTGIELKNTIQEDVEYIDRTHIVHRVNISNKGRETTIIVKPAYYIVMLSRNFKHEKDINVKQILDSSIEKIKTSRDIIGENYIIIDTTKEKIKNLYKLYGFKERPHQRNHLLMYNLSNEQV